MGFSSVEPRALSPPRCTAESATDGAMPGAGRVEVYPGWYGGRVYTRVYIPRVYTGLSLPYPPVYTGLSLPYPPVYNGTNLHLPTGV